MDETTVTPRDSYGPDAFLAGVPHDLFDRDRAAAPVRWVEHRPGDGYWSVTTHALTKEVLGDQPRFSSWRGGISIKDSSERALAAQRQMLITMDPPEHTAHRLTVNMPASGGRATSSRRSPPRSPSS
jgi:cytochrome P450